MSSTVKINIRQLPHAEGVALPAYQSADAAGMDLLAAVPAVIHAVRIDPASMLRAD